MSAPEDLLAPPHVEMWQPSEISPQLLAAHNHFNDISVSQPATANARRAARLLAHRLRESVDADVKSSQDTAMSEEALPEYRASRALQHGSANCIAQHEMTLGYFKSLGIPNGVGVWNRWHAYCGVMLADEGYKIDSTFRLNRPLNETNTQHISPETQQEAWQTCLASQQAVLITASTEKDDQRMDNYNFHEVNELEVPPNFIYELVMPAEASVRALAFLGDCVRYRNSGKPEKLGKIALLQPFVPSIRR